MACEAPQQIIFPDITGSTIEQVQALLEDYQIELNISGNPTDNDQIITGQHPRAGSIVNIDQLKKVELIC